MPQHTARAGVEFDIAQLQLFAVCHATCIGITRHPAQDCADARHQYTWIARFGKIIIGTRREQAYGTACRAPDGSWELISTSQ